MTDARKLAELLLDWGLLDDQRQQLESEIESAIMSMEKPATQTVGDVRATYSDGRKTYDPMTAAVNSLVNDDEQYRQLYDRVLANHTTEKIDWGKVCKDLEIPQAAIPFKQGEPYVKVKKLK